MTNEEPQALVPEQDALTIRQVGLIVGILLATLLLGNTIAIWMPA